MKLKKGTPEHDEFIEKLDEVADNVGGDIHSDYSGRFMYGKNCYGIDGEDLTDLLMEIGRLELPKPKTDSMGRGVIVYWPDVEGDE